MSKSGNKTLFDPADYLDDVQALSDYMSDALGTEDPAFISDAIGVIARARGMQQIAEQTGLSRESLYRTLSSSGNPELTTLLKLISALGLKLHAVPKNDDCPNITPTPTLRKAR